MVIEAVCQGLVFSLGKIGRLGRGMVLDRRRLSKLLKADPGVDRALAHASRRLAAVIEVQPGVPLEALQDLLRSSEMEAIVRQIFSLGLRRKADKAAGTKVDRESTARFVQDEFVALFERAIGAACPDARGAALELFQAILFSCELTLKRMIDDEELGAHEALSGARFAFVRGELERIQQKLDEPPAARVDQAGIQEFEERYRKSVQVVHRHIKPPHLLDEEQRVPIEKLYVQPILLAPGQIDEQVGKPPSLSLQEFVSQAFRAVVLGNPGGGKSTFVQNLCVALACDSQRPFYDGRSISPLWVVLREYSKDRHEEGLSIIDHIEKVANLRYQVKPPPGAIDQMLAAGRLIVFFDGLDELLITRHRREIRSDIEAFCSQYPAVPVIATSRVIGYGEAPLDRESFTEYRLGQFRRQDVHAYARRWYELVGTPDGSSPEVRAERLVQETTDIADLAANPLMLALICNLSLAMRELPQSRPRIFEACSEMLFRKWDDQRGFAPVLPFDAHVKPTLEYLANWIYTSEQRQAGVERDALIGAATDYLAESRFPTREEARKAAETFIDHCTGRAWVFSDTGSTGSGALLYEFTHRTFLEYYAAQYVVSWSDGIDEVADWLIPRVAAARSDEVAQLVVHILCEQREQARDRLVERLMELLDGEDESARWSAEYFIARCLEFIVPSVALTDRVVKSTVSRLVSWTRKPFPDRRGGPDPLLALGAALRCSLENRPIVLTSVRAAIAREIEAASPAEIAALELGVDLSEVLNRTSLDSVVPQDLAAGVAAAGWDALEKRRQDLEQRVDDNFLAARICLDEGWITLSDLIDHFGLAALYQPVISTVFRDGRYESVATVLEQGEAKVSDPEDRRPLPLGRRPMSRERRLEMLTVIGEQVRLATMPWIDIVPPMDLGWIVRQDYIRRSPAALFGAICLLLPVIELTVRPGELRESMLLQEIRGSGESLEDGLTRAGLAPQARAFLQRWSDRQFSVVRQ